MSLAIYPEISALKILNSVGKYSKPTDFRFLQRTLQIYVMILGSCTSGVQTSNFQGIFSARILNQSHSRVLRDAVLLRIENRPHIRITAEQRKQ